ncbi:MAG: hypothetical protein EOM14_15775 [Clostridia bacterium]|nr:hypothetical protein [Clostridia bacterium]
MGFFLQIRVIGCFRHKNSRESQPFQTAFTADAGWLFCFLQTKTSTPDRYARKILQFVRKVTLSDEIPFHKQAYEIHQRKNDLRLNIQLLGFRHPDHVQHLCLNSFPISALRGCARLVESLRAEYSMQFFHNAREIFQKNYIFFEFVSVLVVYTLIDKQNEKFMISICCQSEWEFRKLQKPLELAHLASASAP